MLNLCRDHEEMWGEFSKLLSESIDAYPSISRQKKPPVVRKTPSKSSSSREESSDSDKSSSSVESSSHGNSRGVKRSRYETCVGCGRDFVEADNEIGTCDFYTCYPREPEIDEDTGYWEDYDSQCHDVPFEDLPEGYVPPCCDQHGDVPGCSNHAHRTSSQDAYMKRFKA